MSDAEQARLDRQWASHLRDIELRIRRLEGAIVRQTDELEILRATREHMLNAAPDVE